MDHLIFVGLYRLVPNAIKALTIVKPDTVIRWHNGLAMLISRISRRISNALRARPDRDYLSLSET